jgi:lauroyl/myristoyl acyltransferase
MSREEVDCYRLNHIDYVSLPHQFKGLEYLLEAQENKIGVVLLHAHFDSLYIGLALLAKAGLRVNLMSTRITNDPRVPSAISKHYSEKRDVLNKLFSPGKVIHVEDSFSFFIKALKRGEIVVIACDGPATSTERSRPVQFMGGSRLMVAGPQFLAESTHSLIALYTCKETNGSVMEIEITKPTFIEDDGLQKAYSVLETHLLSEPWRWWSSDMLATYSEVDNAEIKPATSPCL